MDSIGILFHSDLMVFYYDHPFYMIVVHIGSQCRFVFPYWSYVFKLFQGNAVIAGRNWNARKDIVHDRKTVFLFLLRPKEQTFKFLPHGFSRNFSKFSVGLFCIRTKAILGG